MLLNELLNKKKIHNKEENFEALNGEVDLDGGEVMTPGESEDQENADGAM